MFLRCCDFCFLIQAKRKATKEFWEEFEAGCANTGLRSKIPDCMITILNACGYNNIWAFKSVEEENIVDLETFVEKRHRTIIDSMDEYRDVKPFEFLPGHRSLIMGIKSQILLMEDVKRKKTMPKRKAKDVNEMELKMSLTAHVSNFCQNISLQVDWSNAIDDFKITSHGDDTSAQCLAQCSLNCPICGVRRTVRFENSWRISNMCKHLRSHLTSQNETPVQTSNDNQAAIQSVEPSSANNVEIALNEYDNVDETGNQSYFVYVDHDYFLSEDDVIIQSEGDDTTDEQ